jgi:hypothetical protein
MFSDATTEPILIGSRRVPKFLAASHVSFVSAAIIIARHPAGSADAIIWRGHHFGSNVCPSHATSSLTIRTRHRHRAGRRRLWSPGSILLDSCSAASLCGGVYSGPACRPVSVRSRCGFIIHCHKPADQRFVCSVFVAQRWPLSSRMARLADPTHIWRRSNSARSNVASLPPNLTCHYTSTPVGQTSGLRQSVVSSSSWRIRPSRHPTTQQPLPPPEATASPRLHSGSHPRTLWSQEPDEGMRPCSSLAQRRFIASATSVRRAVRPTVPPLQFGLQRWGVRLHLFLAGSRGVLRGFFGY